MEQVEQVKTTANSGFKSNFGSKAAILANQWI